ncbi:MAG: hypothetical protein IJW82_00975, partial [Clostridia bacterium]|nr:hypothetical protein [Clostridia bacterium]
SSGFPNLATLTWSRSYNKDTQVSTIYYSLKVATTNSRGQDLTSSSYKYHWYNINKRYLKIYTSSATLYENTYEKLLCGADDSSSGPAQGSVLMSNQESCSNWSGTNEPGSSDGNATIQVSHPNGGSVKIYFLFHVKFNYGDGNPCTYCSIGTGEYTIGPTA